MRRKDLTGKGKETVIDAEAGHVSNKLSNFTSEPEHFV